MCQRFCKALCVKQPWASLICYGIKDIENRTWFTHYRGRLLIVASKKIATQREIDEILSTECREEINKKQEEGIFPSFCELPRNAVIGYVDVVKCTDENVNSIWSLNARVVGNYNWVLENAHIFEEPQMKGIRGNAKLFNIFDLDPDNLPPSK